jgi:hypothetical protein
MRTQTTPPPTGPSGLAQPVPLPEEMEADISSYEFRARSLDPAEHDPTLLVAALEQLEVQRAAIEWLAHADLLRLCLV